MTRAVPIRKAQEIVQGLSGVIEQAIPPAFYYAQ